MESYAVHQSLEGYGHIALDRNGREAPHDVLMSERQARYIADMWGGYVVEVA